MGRQALVSHKEGKKHLKTQNLHAQTVSLKSFISEKTNLPITGVDSPVHPNRELNEASIFIFDYMRMKKIKFN